MIGGTRFTVVNASPVARDFLSFFDSLRGKNLMPVACNTWFLCIWCYTGGMRMRNICVGRIYWLSRGGIVTVKPFVVVSGDALRR